MDEFEFQDPHYTSESESQLNLSIQIACQFISFAIQEKSDLKLLYLKHIPFEQANNWNLLAEQLEKVLDSQDKLPSTVSSVNAMWISEKYTLVPREFTDEKYLKRLFKAVHPLDELEELDLLDLKETGYQLLFSLPQEIAHLLKKRWTNLQFFHQLMPLHNTYIRNIPRQDSTNVLTQVYPEFADIVVYQKGILKLANSFGLREKTDLVYHLLNIFNHFDLDPASESLTVVDHYLHGLSGQEAIKNYFRNSNFVKAKIPESNLSLFQSQDVSRYVNLLNLINCA
jgi:hypothetical protein